MRPGPEGLFKIGGASLSGETEDAFEIGVASPQVRQRIPLR